MAMRPRISRGSVLFPSSPRAFCVLPPVAMAMSILHRNPLPPRAAQDRKRSVLQASISRMGTVAEEAGISRLRS